jgi:hypothetical protein
MVAKKLPPKPMYTASAYSRGIKIENMEHGLPMKYTRKLVVDHLTEDPRYYSRHH